MNDPQQIRVFFYCRVSTSGQTIDNQVLQLQQVADARGWKVIHIFSDVASGARDRRPGFDEMMRHVRRGKADIIATQALDRLARSSRTLITLVDELRRLGVGLYSYRETIDSSSAMGELIFVVFAGLAQFELSVLKERTCAGLQRAVARGKRLGRPPKAAVDILEAQRLIAEGLSKKAVAVRLGVPRTSLLRALNGVSKNASKTGLASA